MPDQVVIPGGVELWLCGEGSPVEEMPLPPRDSLRRLTLPPDDGRTIQVVVTQVNYWQDAGRLARQIFALGRSVAVVPAWNAVQNMEVGCEAG